MYFIMGYIGFIIETYFSKMQPGPPVLTDH
jgi:hypothetical protein